MEKTIATSRAKLPLMEAFLTQQGEGFHTGEPAYFVRLGGCDVGCHWCDTMDSWDMSLHPVVAVDEMVKRVEIDEDGIVVVTGGEPTMHDLSQLTDSLHAGGYRRHIETAGSYELTGDWDWVCLSPKKPVPPKPSIYGLADELKMVIYNMDDFRWAEENATRVTPNCKLYLQPEWSKEAEMKEQIEKFISKHPEWSLSVQTHKHLGIR